MRAIPTMGKGEYLAGVITSAICGLVLIPAPSQADKLKLPEELGRVDSPRDTNIFQVEPSVLNERYYASGRAERHQSIGNVLPSGAEIPDTDVPVPISSKTGNVSQKSPAPQMVQKAEARGTVSQKARHASGK